jgi:hypothetical protein
MSKYVPRFMKDSASPAAHTAHTAPTEQAEPRRWGAELKPVVNTSLPAQLAPKLKPVTLASATATPLANGVPLAPISIKNQKAAANVSSMDDFPSLGGKSVAKPMAASGTSFAALSRTWAQQQKEDDAKAKEEAEREASWKQYQQQLREKEAIENSAMQRISLSGAVHLLNKKKGDSDDEKFFEDDKSRHSEDYYSSDEPEEEVFDDDENEEDYVNDGTWDPRKHRDELY